MRKRKIFWGMFLIWMAADGVRHRNFFEMIFAAAFLYIIYDKPLEIEVLTPWTVLAVALMFSIGLSLLFGGKREKKHSIEFEWGSEGFRGIGNSSEQCSGEQIRCGNTFGSAIRYIHSDNFCKANLENNFGETNLYIPKEWKVHNELDHVFGNINEHGKCMGTSSAELRLKGETNFGNIEIYYV